MVAGAAAAAEEVVGAEETAATGIALSDWVANPTSKGGGGGGCGDGSSRRGDDELVAQFVVGGGSCGSDCGSGGGSARGLVAQFRGGGSGGGEGRTGRHGGVFLGEEREQDLLPQRKRRKPVVVVLFSFLAVKRVSRSAVLGKRNKKTTANFRLKRVPSLHSAWLAAHKRRI